MVCPLFSHPNFDWRKNVFGVDNSSQVNINKKRRDILVLGKGPTVGLVIATEPEYSICFSTSGKENVFVCMIMETTVLFVSTTKNALKTGLNGYEYDFFCWL